MVTMSSDKTVSRKQESHHHGIHVNTESSNDLLLYQKVSQVYYLTGQNTQLSVIKYIVKLPTDGKDNGKNAR